MSELLEAKSSKVPAAKPRNFVAKNAVNTGAGAHKDKKKSEKQGDVKHKKSLMPMENTLSELSTEKLAQYKKAAGADARKADAAKDYERGNKRFKGINKATIKQFDNDLKKHGVAETATAGGTSAGNVGVGAVYKNKKPKMQKPGTNALDGDNLMTGGSIKR